MRRSILLVVMVMTVAAFLIAPPFASGQNTKPVATPQDDDRQVLRALLEEMRQLRLALQRSQLASQRIQVTLERIRLGQARMDSITRALENLRARLAYLKESRPGIEEQLKHAEELLGRAADPDRRAELEEQVKQRKGLLSLWKQEGEQLRTREAELISQLQVEQAKLTDLNDQLEDMVRALGTP